MHNNEKRQILHKCFAVVNQFLPMLFWVTLMLGLEEPRVAWLTVLAAIIHESGHISFLKLKKIRGDWRGVISGMRIKSDGVMTYGEEMMLYAAGPLANLLAAAIAMPFGSEGAVIFGTLNIATAFSNLLPIEGYDGYGILRVWADMRDCSGMFGVVLKCLSPATVLLFTVFSVYLIDRFGVGYWIFGIFFFSLLGKLNEWLKNTKFED